LDHPLSAVRDCLFNTFEATIHIYRTSPPFVTRERGTPRRQEPICESVSKSFRTESITKYTITTMNTRWEATQRVMEVNLTRLTHKIAIQLHLVAESCTICSSRSRRPVRKLLDTPI
jgi:hypothetical protein